MKEIKDALARLVRRTFGGLYDATPDDAVYGVFLAGPPEGTFFYPLLFTRQRLAHVATTYLRKGYHVTRGDPMTVLRTHFRWAPGEDWHCPPPGASAEVSELLDAALSRGEFELYDGKTVELCLEALRDLDREGAFEAAERPVLGFTHRCEGPDEFMGWIRALNPPDVAEIVEAQVAEGLAAERWVRSPH